MMPEQTSFRQVDEKHVSVEAELMLWSPKIDLVALSNVQGEVVLHRLSWQKVWSLPPPVENVKVSALAWRPDGKVLAVAYTSGRINLCDIENADVLHSLDMEGQITCMNWICQVLPEGAVWSADPYPEDNSETYLPRLNPLTKSYGTLTKGHIVEESVEDSKKLKEQKELNLLVVGTSSNQLQLFTYGVFPTGVVSLDLQNGTQLRRICSALLSQDLQSLVVLVETGGDMAEDSDFCLLSYDTKLLAERHKELRVLALKYGQISTLISYLQSIIQQMAEAWEDILMEMDSKLLKFAEDKKNKGMGTVSNDFLELLMFGTPSQELQAFLLYDLTEKGLKKLGHSIETSYSNIQKLVVKHLQNVSQAVLYHLSEVRGMSMWYERFGVLGLNVQSLQEAVTMAGSFVLKTSELQQVIDGSIKNFKAFFRWLYVVILRLSDEKPPPELSKMTQHDINFVAEFLRDNFAQFSVEEDSLSALTGTDKKPGFKLEKVGQYLKKEDLHYPPDISGNPWTQFLRASVHQKDNPVLYPIQTDKSLVQLQDRMENIIISALSKPSVVIGQSLQCLSSTHLYSTPVCESEEDKPYKPKVVQFTSPESKRLYTVFTVDPAPCERIYILRQPTDAHSLQGNAHIVGLTVGTLGKGSADTSVDSETDRCEQHKILDMAYYDEKTLSLLLVEDTEDQVPVMFQLPLSIIPEDHYTVATSSADIITSPNIQTVDVGMCVAAQNYRRLDNMKAHSFAVSGTRKTATVLFSSRRRVRIFLMDAEEEEDEDDEEEDLEEAYEAVDMESRQEEGPAAPATDSMQVEESEEDKENTSYVSQDTESGHEAEIGTDH